MKTEENLPVVENKEFREKQMERFTEGIGNLGDYAKEMKKSAKIGMIVGLISTGFFLVLIIGVIGYQLIAGNGLEGMFDDGVLTRRFDCVGNDTTQRDTLRNYEDAERFVKLYGGGCTLWHIP